MIPRAQVEVAWAVDYPSVRSPSAAELEDGGFATRGYSLGLVVDATWEEADELILWEAEAIARLAEQARDDQHYDDLACEAEEEDSWVADPNEGFVAAPDIGLRAACLALCAGGCVTAASCRGHPQPGAWSTYPTILLHADRRRARLLETLARAARCGLASVDSGLELWAPSVEEVLRFAKLLLSRRQEFDDLPLPESLRGARGMPLAGRSTRPHVSDRQQTVF
jgi:hypothetical protein